MDQDSKPPPVLLRGCADREGAVWTGMLVDKRGEEKGETCQSDRQTVEYDDRDWIIVLNCTERSCMRPAGATVEAPPSTAVALRW